MITITENVDTKVAEILREETEPNASLRVFVQGGGWFTSSHYHQSVGV